MHVKSMSGLCVCECVCHNGRRENKLPKTPPEPSRTQAASEKLNESDRQSRAMQGMEGREVDKGRGEQWDRQRDRRTAGQAGSQAGRQSARRLVVAAAVGIGEGAIKRVTRASRLKS